MLIRYLSYKTNSFIRGKGKYMDNQRKADLLKPWINPEERITVDFKDAQGLNATIAGCTDHVVHLIFQEAFPHMKEHLTIPLRHVEVDEDPYHYNRDPTTTIRNRLRLRIAQNRPEDL